MFIAIEGVDGSGKTTAIEIIKELAPDAVFTREPGGTKLGEELRQYLLHREDVEVSPMAEAMLLAASRTQHMKEVILPALEAKKVVITDRFTMSSYVYQGIVGKLGTQTVKAINEAATFGVKPHVTLYLRPEWDIVVERISQRKELDKVERDLFKLHEVYQAYELVTEQAVREGHVVVPIDSGSGIDVMRKQLTAFIRIVT